MPLLRKTFPRVYMNLRKAYSKRTSSPGHKKKRTRKQKEHMEDAVPLRVKLPPDTEKESKTVFTIDCDKNMPISVEADTTDNNITDNSINVEEFECGVSVAGSDRQEWMFTLYNFDDRGKVTKEDIAQLLKALYDAVGSSINLPQTGTKTLKLRLTVSPDYSKVSDGIKQEMKIAIRDNSKNQRKESKNKENTRHHMKQNNLIKAKKMNTDVDSGLPRGVMQNNLQKSSSPEVCSPVREEDPASKAKVSFVDQRQLADLVHQNMERNKQRQSKHRRHNSEHISSSKRRSHSRPQTATKAEENLDRRHYYQDLAGIDNTANQTDNLNKSAPAAMLDLATSNLKTPENHNHRRSNDHKHRSQSSRAKRASQTRSKLYDPATVDAVVSTEQYIKDIEKTVEHDVVNDSNVQSPKLVAKSLSKSACARLPSSLLVEPSDTISSHHVRRHKHRLKNQYRAMQNVQEWIQNQQNPAGAEEEVLVDCSPENEGERVVIQRHEHHHVHTHHHHHHYHHYHDA